MLQRSALEEKDVSVLRRWSGETISFLFWTAIFGLAHTQAPLYFSNQNQYFLHGLAQAELGSLDQDWLAGTRDPTPVFSGLVAFTARYLHPSVFYLYYFLILGAYFHSLVGIFTVLTGYARTSVPGLCFIALFTVLHSGLLRLASVWLLGTDYPWYLQCGVAGQYVLGPGLQPSTFGVLLLVSLYAFLRDRPFVAVTCSSLAVVMHATYVLGAAFFTLSYLYLCWRDRRGRTALLLGAWGLLLVLPILIYHFVTFAPTSAEQFANSQHILAEFRIPHHAVPGRWLDKIAVAQVAWIVLSLILVYGSRLFLIVQLVFGLSLGLTVVQMWTGNASLALLFPWRTSAILMPIATTVILARLLQLLAPWFARLSTWQEVGIQFVCAAMLAAAVDGGIAIRVRGQAYHSNPDEQPLIEYIRQHRGERDVYLLPVSIPKPVTGPTGVISTSFTSPPTGRQAGHLVAVDFQRFRLDTGAPIVVDFKSIPYKDVEVLEWRDRLKTVQELYNEPNWDKADVQATLTRYQVTHVIVPVGHDIRSASLIPVRTDDHYVLYQVRRP